MDYDCGSCDRRIGQNPFAGLGRRWGLKPESMAGILIGSVSTIPVLSMYKDMDEKGKIMNAAFLVSGTSILAAHMGFAASVEPEMTGALLGGKFVGGVCAAAFVLVVCAGRKNKISG